MRRFLAATLVMGISALPLFAGNHQALLPGVRSIHYGSGSIDACSLSVTVARTTDTDDAFAAAELRKVLKDVCGGTQRPTRVVSLILSGEQAAMPGAADGTGPRSREAYQITIDLKGVKVRAASSAGLFYGTQTLRQMLEREHGRAVLPVAEVEDWPALAYRGFMMDMAHGAVPTEDEVKRQLDEIARWKGNQYYFYSEANIELAGYPLLRNESFWSSAAIRRIIAYARARHIDVVPCVELYGHLHDLFRLEHYARLAGLPHGGEINPRDRAAITITEDWMRQLAALFPSPWFHIGMDEPWELERADPSVAKPEQFYLEQLRRLSALAVQLGKRPMFWADVEEGAFLFKKYPELYSQLPKEVIAVPWYYSALPDFTPLVKPFADHRVPQVVAPGIAYWEETSPDFDQTFTNIDDFVSAGRRFGVLGMVNTAWTDSAQALYRAADPALAYGAIAAWQEQPVRREEFFQEYAQIEFPKADIGFAQALKAMSRAQRLLRQSLGGETMFRLWDDPLEPSILARVAPHLSELHECRLEVENAQTALLKAEEQYPTSETIATLKVTLRILNFAALKYVYASEVAASFEHLPEHPTNEDVDFYLQRQAGARNHSRIADLMDEAAEIAQVYDAAWRMQYRPYRLKTALGRWAAEFEYWRSLQARIWEAIRDFEQTGRRPDLKAVHRAR